MESLFASEEGVFRMLYSLLREVYLRKFTNMERIQLIFFKFIMSVWSSEGYNVQDSVKSNVKTYTQY